jgi:hypothetical protein
MRDYVQKQNRQAITGVVEVVTSVKPEEPARYKGRFKLNTWSHKTKAKALNARREKGLTSEATANRHNRKTSTLADDDTQLVLSRPWEHRSPNPGFFLDEHRIDPFVSLVVKLGSRSEELLLHCKLIYYLESIFSSLHFSLTPQPPHPLQNMAPLCQL